MSRTVASIFRLNNLKECSLHKRHLQTCGFLRSASVQINQPLGPNDQISPQIRNRNPMNLEKMRIGLKPTGFTTERASRNYWNKLELKITTQHATATVTHWTGRLVCSASTEEWAVRKFLYNLTDAAAVKIVGKVIGQRLLETGITSIFHEITEDDLQKERMRVFYNSVKSTGIVLSEGPQYNQNPPFRILGPNYVTNIKPWEVLEK